MTITIGARVRVLGSAAYQLQGRDLTVVGVWHHNRWLDKPGDVERLVELDEHTWLQVRPDPSDKPHAAPWIVRTVNVEPIDG